MKIHIIAQGAFFGEPIAKPAAIISPVLVVKDSAIFLIRGASAKLQILPLTTLEKESSS
jgi:hypothetical protein